MAEKEERIYVRGYGENNPCDTCEDTSGEECDYCMENYEWNASISRQEAIEKMAKGIHFYEWAHDKHFPKWNELNSDIQNDYKNMAEAALNALLED